MVSVDIKHHVSLLTIRLAGFSAQELCESRGGRPGLPVPNSPYGLCGRKATLNLTERVQSSETVKEEVDVQGSPSLIVRTALWT